MAGPPGSCFDPTTDPFVNEGGTEVTLAEARRKAKHRLYPPETQLASDASLTHVWIGVEPHQPPMLPARNVTEVALTYASGIQITVVPWQYGPKAPPFSQAQAAAHFRLIVHQATAGAFTTGTLDGVPFLANQENRQNIDNPRVLQFFLGTANANATTLLLVGHRSAGDLASVAKSIIRQFRSAHAS